ncbi:MAG: hypothetical protein ACLT2C_08820 [Ruminococcus sp.]
MAAITGGRAAESRQRNGRRGKTYMVDEALLALDAIAAEFVKED